MLRLGVVTWNRRCAIVLVCLAAVVVMGVGMAGVGVADDESPHAEAGLDQSVYQHETVQLDGGGSHAPAGDLVGYEWAIQAPDGSTLTPDCPTCVKADSSPTRPERTRSR